MENKRTMDKFFGNKYVHLSPLKVLNSNLNPLWLKRVVYTSHLHHLLLWIENQTGISTILSHTHIQYPQTNKGFPGLPSLDCHEAAGRSQSACHGHSLGRPKHGLDDSPGVFGGSLPCHQASSWKWLLSSPGLFVLRVSEFWLKRDCQCLIGNCLD